MGQASIFLFFLFLFWLVFLEETLFGNKQNRGRVSHLMAPLFPLFHTTPNTVRYARFCVFACMGFPGAALHRRGDRGIWREGLFIDLPGRKANDIAAGRVA